jgi:hypothetical protein
MDENKKLVIILSICLAVFLLAAFAKTLAADCNEYTINGVFDGPDPYAPVIIDCASPCGIETLPFRPMSRAEDVVESRVEQVQRVSLVILPNAETIKYYASLSTNTRDQSGCHNVFDCAATAYQHCGERLAIARMVTYNASAGENGCMWQCSDNVAGRLSCSVLEDPGGRPRPGGSRCDINRTYDECHPCFIGPVEPGACEDGTQASVGR